MPETRAQRTLVKSPPELWAEISDLATLARHLGEFGEVRITRTEPETTVAWEGETARGTVELEASGWGTKVTLTAELKAIEAALPEPVAPEPEQVAPEPVAPAPEPEAVEPEPMARAGFFARLFGRSPKEVAEEPSSEPVSVAPAPEPVPEPELVPDEPEAEPGELRVGEPVADRPPDTDAAAAVLSAVLDDLGAAHHRPFSRG